MDMIIALAALILGAILATVVYRVDPAARLRERAIRRESARLAGWVRWYGADLPVASAITWQYVAEAMARPGHRAPDPDRANPWITAVNDTADWGRTPPPRARV